MFKSKLLYTLPCENMFLKKFSPAFSETSKKKESLKHIKHLEKEMNTKERDRQMKEVFFLYIGGTLWNVVSDKSETSESWKRVRADNADKKIIC